MPRALAGLVVGAVLLVALLGVTVSPSLLTPPGPVRFLSGSSGAPGGATTADTDTGFYWPAQDAFAITAAGSERARVHANALSLTADLWYATDNVYDLGGISQRRPRDVTVARDVHIAGYLHAGTGLIHRVHAVTIADEATAAENQEILSGLFSVYKIHCRDVSGGCALHISSTLGTPGHIVRIVNVDTNQVIVNDSAVVGRRAHTAGSLYMVKNSTIQLMLMPDSSDAFSWYEIGRSIN